MSGWYRWFAVGFILALYTGVFLALWFVDGFIALAERTAPIRMRARLARWRENLADERNERTRESRAPATLATVARTSTQASVEPDETGLFI